MIKAIGRIFGAIKTFRAAERGVAAVEFAILLPVMLATYVGTMEASIMLIVDRKVQNVSSSLGDLVARSDKTITTAQIQDYFRAASGIMTPYPFEPVSQSILALSVDNNGVATVLWSRQFKNGTVSSTPPRSVGSPYPLPKETVAISKGRTVIAAEATYSYAPVTGLFFDHQIGLHHASYFLPRFGGTITPL